MTNHYTKQTQFYGHTTPEALIAKYGSPLYVYNESILRERSAEMRRLVNLPSFTARYSAKANANMELLKIVREEGLHADAMSAGEILVLLRSGYKAEEILFIPNNVSEEEMRYALDAGVLISVDSLSQLERLGRIHRGGEAAVRLNPGVGVGHHEKVVTAGTKTKFGIGLDQIDDIKRIADTYRLRIVGINQHMGSLFKEPSFYLEGVDALLRAADRFEDLQFIDFGGGFGIPYRKQEEEERLDLKALGESLTAKLERWAEAYGKPVSFYIEPGRYVVAECGVLLGTVHAVKQNGAATYIGTDLGFNVLARPVMYDSWHDLEFYRDHAVLDANDDATMTATIVGNICESGDAIAKERKVPLVREGDVCGVIDAGAYGFAMSSNYNNRLRPAEVLIGCDGTDRLIRKRDALEDLLRHFV